MDTAIHLLEDKQFALMLASEAAYRLYLEIGEELIRSVVSPRLFLREHLQERMEAMRAAYLESMQLRREAFTS